MTILPILKTKGYLWDVPTKTASSMSPSVLKTLVSLSQRRYEPVVRFRQFFSPQTIHGRHYIDGQVTKSCDLELVVSEELDSYLSSILLPTFTRLIPGSADQEGGVYGIIQTVKAHIVSLRNTSESYYRSISRC